MFFVYKEKGSRAVQALTRDPPSSRDRAQKSTTHGPDHGIIATIITPQHDDAKRHDNRHTITKSPTGYHDTTIISRNEQPCQPGTRLHQYLHKIFTNRHPTPRQRMMTIVHIVNTVHTANPVYTCVQLRAMCTLNTLVNMCACVYDCGHMHACVHNVRRM